MEGCCRGGGGVVWESCVKVKGVEVFFAAVLKRGMGGERVVRIDRV